MRFAQILSMAALSSLLVATPCQAANDSDDATYARKVMTSFAACTIRLEHRLARKFVLMSPADRLPAEEFQKIADGRCLGYLGGRLKMPQFEYRAALAEQLIRVESVRFSDAEAKTRPALDWSIAGTYRLDSPTGLGEFQLVTADNLAPSVLGPLGECIVRANVAGAFAVIFAKKPADEVAAINVLSPQMTACVEPDQTVKVPRSMLRDALALSYYRLAMARPLAPQEAAK